MSEVQTRFPLLHTETLAQPYFGCRRARPTVRERSPVKRSEHWPTLARRGMKQGNHCFPKRQENPHAVVIRDETDLQIATDSIQHLEPEDRLVFVARTFYGSGEGA